MVVFPLGFPGFITSTSGAAMVPPTSHRFGHILRLNGPVPSLEEPSSASKTLREERESQKRRCAEWEKPKLPELKARGRDRVMSVSKAWFWLGAGWLFDIKGLYYVPKYVGILWDSYTPCIGRIPMNELI